MNVSYSLAKQHSNNSYFILSCFLSRITSCAAGIKNPLEPHTAGPGSFPLPSAQEVNKDRVKLLVLW